MKTGTKSVVIITGASSGIGKVTAQLFVAQGYRVYDLSRHGTDSNGVCHIDCDVTCADVCQKAVAEVVNKESRVDVLICNAGIGISGAVEFTESEAAHQQMEVNFFGVVNMVQAVLPTMRAARKGRILLVSSMAAEFAIPFQAFYSASKSAVNALALALRNELCHFNIKVACLLPGDANTGFTLARKKNAMGAAVYVHMTHAVQVMERDEEKGLSPHCLAKALLRMARVRNLKPYYTVGTFYKCVLLLSRVLPKSYVNAIVGRIYGVR